MAKKKTGIIFSFGIKMDPELGEDILERINALNVSSLSELATLLLDVNMSGDKVDFCGLQVTKRTIVCK